MHLDCALISGHGIRTDPDRLLAIYTSDFSGPPYGGSSYPDYEAIAQAEVFMAAALYTQRVAGLGDPDAAQRIGVELVTPNFFSVFGVPLRGRALDATDTRTDDAVAIISDAL